MTEAIIGIVSGVIIIALARMLQHINKSVFYGLTLCGIGFLYVGFTWRQTGALIISSAQAIFFLFFAYYGIKKSLLLLAAGFFLHGCWDLFYGQSTIAVLAPPHYDVFCLSVDFTIGAYLLLLQYQRNRANKISTTKIHL